MADFSLKAAAENAMNTAKVQQELAKTVQADLNGDGKISEGESFDKKVSLFEVQEDGSVKIDIDGDGIYDKVVRGLVREDGTTNIDGTDLKISDEKYGSVKVQAFLNKAQAELKAQTEAEGKLENAKNEKTRLENAKKEYAAQNGVFDAGAARTDATTARNNEITTEQGALNDLNSQMKAYNDGTTKLHEQKKTLLDDKKGIEGKIQEANNRYKKAFEKVQGLQKQLDSIKDHTSCDYVTTKKQLEQAKGELETAYKTHEQELEKLNKELKAKNKEIAAKDKEIENAKAELQEKIDAQTKKINKMKADLEKNVEADVAKKQSEHFANLEAKLKEFDTQIKQQEENIKKHTADIKKHKAAHAKWADKYNEALTKNQQDQSVCESDSYKTQGLSSNGKKAEKSQTAEEAEANDPILAARKKESAKQRRMALETAVQKYKSAVAAHHAKEASTEVGGEKSAAKALKQAKENLREVAARFGITDTKKLVEDYDKKQGEFATK